MAMSRVPARLAREIVRRRASRPFATSDDLVGAIRGAFGARTGPPEFARLFQAVRIAVNDEIAALTAALPLLRDRLDAGRAVRGHRLPLGRGSLVKHTFREWSQACRCPPRQPSAPAAGVAMGAGDHPPGDRCATPGRSRAQPPRPERAIERVGARRVSGDHAEAAPARPPVAGPVDRRGWPRRAS